MGLFNFIKKQLLEIVQCKAIEKGVIVKRFERKDREEIMNSSTLIVGPNQSAIFVHKGQICDVFGPGTYKLATENIPFITKLLSLPTGFNSPIDADVYFVNMQQFAGNKWGTQNPIMMRDADFGNVRIRGFGVYAFRVIDPKMFMNEMFGQNNLYKVADVEEQIKPMVISAMTDAVAESKISALDLAANYNEFSSTVLECSKEKFGKFGLQLCNLVIENLSLPEEVEKALDERTKLGVLEDKMGTYTQYQAANAMRDAAQNESGNNFAGMGVGLGAGVTMGNYFGQNLNFENPTVKKVENKSSTATCEKCGASMKDGVKFCPECGAKQGSCCEKCGATLVKGAKFCPECGTSTMKVCKKCGKALQKNAKFCPECGERVDE